LCGQQENPPLTITMIKKTKLVNAECNLLAEVVNILPGNVVKQND